MKKKPLVEGFGAPKEFGIHHFRVDIPRSLKESVVIIEDFGLSGGTGGIPHEEKRILLPKTNWTIIAEATGRDFNARLKAHKLPLGRWSIGSTKVERLLGKELCVLAWAVEKATRSQVEVAIRKWLSLRPEERWWLFTMTVAEAGKSEDVDGGWRAALRYALGSQTKEPSYRTPSRRRPQCETDQFLFPLISE